MKTIFLIPLVLAVIVTVVAYAAHAANSKTERQPYKVIKQAPGFEVRFYPAAIMATVRSAEHKGSNRNNNFRRLAGYIFGGNNKSQKIAMTAPVYMEQDGAANKMSFVLPAGYKMEDLPTPADSAVTLSHTEDGYYAALRFGGFASDKKIARKQEALKNLLKDNGYETIGNYKYLGYNAPWDVVNRENDVIVRIKYAN